MKILQILHKIFLAWQKETMNGVFRTAIFFTQKHFCLNVFFDICEVFFKNELLFSVNRYTLIL